MGHHTEEEHNGNHHHKSDDCSDDDGHSRKKSAKKKESDDKSSSSSSSSSSRSSSSSSSSSKSTSHHHGNGARAHGEEEVMSPGKNGAEDNALVESLEKMAVPATIEEELASNGVEDCDHGPISLSEAPEENMPEERGIPDVVVVEREEGIREESEVSDAPVYDKFLVATEDHEVKEKDGRRSVRVQEASLDSLQGSERKYDVVLSETVEGIHDTGECDAPESTEEISVPEPVEESVKPETTEATVVVSEPEEEDSAKDVIEENSVSSVSEDQAPVDEKREIFDAIVVDGEGDGHADSTFTENSAPEETEEESGVAEFEGNGNAHEEDVASEIVKSEATEETVVVPEHEEESVKDVIEEKSGQSSLSEEQASSLDCLEGGKKKEISAAVVLEGEGEGRAEKSAPEKAEEEPAGVEIEANGIALEDGIASVGSTNLAKSEKSSELAGKSGHDDRLEGEDGGGKEPQPVRSHRELSVELGSPLEHQRRFIRQMMTPSPPKRENSVYKIVMALEGLQVGEKCIHGEIDHGVCHQRYGDRRISSSPSFSPSARAYRETSTSPKDREEIATPDGKDRSAEVRVSDGEKREVDSDWSFVQHDFQSGITTQQTSTIKTETYTDTVVFRRDDGFLPRTPGRSPLSGSQSMRAVFSQADASGPTTPKLKIVHEFPAERNDGEDSHDGASTSTLARSVEGESEVERILRLQETHDLVCPVCRSCITKRVILRKRKRTTVISVDKWETEVHDEEEENTQEQAHDIAGDTVVDQYEDYGCLGCFTFLFRRERNVQHTQVVELPGAAEAAASVSVASFSQITDEGAIRLPETVAELPPVPTDADYDNRCLPIFFTWRRKTTSPTDSDVVAPLLSNEEKKLSDDSSVEFLSTQSRDVPAEDLPASETQQSAATEIQQPPASEILELPAAHGAVEGVQIPVVVVESREDRLCFPFLWRRATKTTQSELLQPLLTKENIEHQSDVVKQQSKEIKQQSKEIKHQSKEFKQQSEDVKQKSVEFEQQSKEIKQQSDEVKQQSEYVEQQTEDFTRIEDDLWMRREVLLEVPVSVPPQEGLTTPSSSRTPDSSEMAAQPDTSFKAIRITEAERRMDCLCFPSWSSSETTSEETEVLLPVSSRITNSLQGATLSAASGTESTERIQTFSSVQGVPLPVAPSSEGTENIQTSTILKGVVVPVSSSSEASEIISSSTALKEAVSAVTSGTEGVEITFTSPSLKGAVLPVASSTEDREAQRATLNCMDCMVILIPSYPWGPPGTGSRKEVLGRTEEHSGSATSTQFEFSTVGQVINKGVVILPEQAVSESSKQLGSQSNKLKEEIVLAQTSSGSVKQHGSQSMKSQEVIVMAQSTKGSGLSENEISTMRKEDSRCLPLLLPTISWRRQELTTEEILDQSSKTKTAESKSSMASENKSHVATETKSYVTTEGKPYVTADRKSSGTAESKSFGTAESKSSGTAESKSSGTAESKSSGIAETDLSQGKEVKKEIGFGDIEVSRNQNQKIEQNYNDIGAEVMDEEEPLVRKPPTSKNLTPSKVEPLPAEEGQRVIVSVETNDSGLSEVHERDISFSQDFTTPNFPTVRPVDETYEEERREKGSWNCCLPSYTQLAYQPIEDRVTGKQQAAPESSGGVLEASGSHVSDETESIFHEEVLRETKIDARITTQTTTTRSHTDATYGETIDAVSIDTSMSEVQASVQHDEGAVEATLHLDDHPTFSLQPADKLPAAPMLEEGNKHMTQPPLGPTYSTGYAALAHFLKDEEEDAAINEWLADSSRQGNSWKETLPSDAVTEVEQDTGEGITLSEAVTTVKIPAMLSGSVKKDVGDEITLAKVKVPAILSESVKQDIGREIARGDSQGTQVQEPGSIQEDVSCCLPNSKWLWGRRKLTSEEVLLREPLLGRVSTQLGERGLLQGDSEVDSKYSSANVTVQQIHEATGTTMSSGAGRVNEEDECSCLPWSSRNIQEAQLRELLLGRDTPPQVRQPGLLQGDSEVDSKSDSSAHVTLQQTNEVTHTTTSSSAGHVSDEEKCNCFPWSGRYNRDSTEIDTVVTVTADDTVIEVEGTDATSTLAAARHAAEDAGMMDGALSQQPEYLKSIVYGGLDVSLTSLGVVASAAGGDTKIRNVLALGLANLIFGFIAFYSKIQDLHKESPARFQESVGPRFWINGPLAMLSFLFFGSLPVLAFGFSFRGLNDHDYKMVATVLVSTIAIIFLGCGKVAAKMTELSYRRTLTTLITTGIVAAVAGFYTGEYISKLLEKYGILDE